MENAPLKLSEAILLGSTILAPKAGRQYISETQEGCALGMAAVAGGASFRRTTRQVSRKQKRTLGTEGVWGSWVLQLVIRPCDCWRLRVPKEMRVKDAIAHLFDYHVMKKRNWSLERLADWVKTFEPESTGQQKMCDRFASRPSPSSAWLAELRQTKEIRKDASEWKMVRENFEANHKSPEPERLQLRRRNRA